MLVVLDQGSQTFFLLPKVHNSYSAWLKTSHMKNTIGDVINGQNHCAAFYSICNLNVAAGWTSLYQPVDSACCTEQYYKMSM
jgi:hypothetical protein